MDTAGYAPAMTSTGGLGPPEELDPAGRSRAIREAIAALQITTQGTLTFLNALSESVEVKRLARSVELVARFIEISAMSRELDDIRPVELLPVSSIDQIQRMLYDARSPDNISTDLIREVDLWVANHIDEALAELHKVRDPGARNAELSLVGLGDSLAVLAALDEASGAAVDVQRTLRHVREAAGATGAVELSKNFGDFGRSQHWQALGWAIVVLLAIASSGMIAIKFAGSGDDSWSAAANHIAVSLPPLAIAAYAGRVSAHHRNAAQWATATAAQLKTISAFVDRIDNDESRRQVLVSFGRRVFGEAVAPGTGASTEQVALLPSDLPEVLRNLADLVGHAVSKK